LLFGIENTLKARKGGFTALIDPTIIKNHAVAEAELRAKVDADPELHAQYGAVWDNIRATLDSYRPKRDRHVFTEGGQGFRSELFGFAKTLVRHAAEAKKPEGAPERIHRCEFPATRQSVTSPRRSIPSREA
jgi:hypothetical protein